jgi:hypothetical protein
MPMPKCIFRRIAIAKKSLLTIGSARGVCAITIGKPNAEVASEDVRNITKSKKMFELTGKTPA